MKKRITSTRRILNSKEFKKLQLIGGHKVYHREGNAFRHSILVWRASKRLFRGDPTMQLVALLHDIGKIYASTREGKGDWKYPNHSIKGGEVLEKFLPKEDKRFTTIRWYIQNHIKPLFWKNIEDSQKLSVPPGCSIEKLAKLALCDLEGSIAPKVDNSSLIELLKKIGGLK